jgi:diguanylate cyclase (GGDEF)-like protein
VPSRIRKDHLSPKMLVFAPITVLTAIVAGAVFYLAARGLFTDPASRRALGISLALYLAAVLVFVRIGLSSIGNLERLGLTDSLSGLPNRRALHLDVARMAEAGDEVALALIDLDGFKSVNDHYGHFVGDKLIKDCARMLLELCAKEARPYRLGGDEFAVVVIGPIAGNILEGICRRLLERLAKPVVIDDRQLSIGASIGLSRSTRKSPAGSSDLLRQSDVAMYASKTGGKMRCTWFTGEFDRKRELSQQIEADLRKAIAENEFKLLYQPLVDARSGEIVAVEALVRWERPDGTAVSPAVFIPIAEETGLINPIGRWVLRRACLDALEWTSIKLSVNVSPAQLRNPDFPVQLGHILEETGFPPSRLELEVTETYLVTDPVVANRNLDVIRQFGVGIALDDFGTGYASIGFLRNFRFEKLKLDRTMVVDAGQDSGSLAMFTSSIAVARAMDMEVTAEGVETQAQADLVRTAGCDQIQGWYYYKAITAPEIRAHLDDLRNRNLTKRNTRKRIGDRHGHVG